MKNSLKSTKNKKIKPPEQNYRPQQFLLSAILAYIIVTVANQILLDKTFSSHKQYSYNQQSLGVATDFIGDAESLKKSQENYLLDFISRINGNNAGNVQEIESEGIIEQEEPVKKPYKLSVSTSKVSGKQIEPGILKSLNMQIEAKNESEGKVNTQQIFQQNPQQQPQQNQQQYSSSTCPAVQAPSRFSQSSIPKYKLRSSHLISSILSWGPNNQLRGLMETIVLSIKLNRTLVLPPFYKHLMDLNPEESDSERFVGDSNYTKYGQLVEPWLWFDVNKISELQGISWFTNPKSRFFIFI